MNEYRCRVFIQWIIFLQDTPNCKVFIFLLQNHCCGAQGPDDWDFNIYFNCSSESKSREKCGVPFSCCIPDPAVSCFLALYCSGVAGEL